MNDYQKNIKLFDIDLTRLEEEWLQQPKNFYVVSNQLADARSEISEAEAEVELARAYRKEIEAQLTLKISSDPAKYKLKEKPTAVLVSSTVLIRPSYKKALQKCRDAQEELNHAWNKVNHLQSLVNSFDQKKSTLEYLVKLHGQNYFSIPQIPYTEEGKRFVDDAKKKSVRRKVKKGSKKNA